MITPYQAQAAGEYWRRRNEALKIFRALPKQEAFFKSQATEVLARGGNRSGKSTISAVLFAALAMDKPVLDAQGQPIEVRRPWQKGRPLTCWVVGYGLDHIGQTLHRLLFRKGAFKIMWDQEQKRWRTYNPVTDGEDEHALGVRPAPPLIPARYIKPNSWAWENKGARCFKQVEIWDPQTKEVTAQIYAFTSSGEVKQGDMVDVIWIDEAIKYPSHYAEWQARIIDRRGRIFWSSYPRLINDALIEITERAEAEKDEPQPVVEEFVFTMSSNPFLPEKAKEDALKGWSDRERKARDLGHYVTDYLMMYHTFHPDIHTAIAKDRKEDELSKVLRLNNGSPPGDWTRYLILDPGTSFPAVLWCAVPPPLYGDFYVPYKELYIPRLDADELAKEVAHRSDGEWFEQFIMDYRAGRQTPMGGKATIHQTYAEAFRKRNLRCYRTGSNFTYGSDNVPGRIGLLQSWMTVGPSGFPKLRIVTENCPNLVKQLSNYRKHAGSSGDPEEFRPAANQRIDLAVSLEYFASVYPEWVPPTEAPRNLSPMHQLYKRLKEEQDRQRKREEAPQSIVLGPAT